VKKVNAAKSKQTMAPMINSAITPPRQNNNNNNNNEFLEEEKN